MTKLTYSFPFSIHPIPPYSFELTARKPAGWPLFTRGEICQGGTLWTALHIGKELVGVKLSSSCTIERPEINTLVFLKGLPEKSQMANIQNILTSKLGADNDLSDFYVLAEKDPILRDTVKDLLGLHNTDFSSIFASATLAISLQMAPIARSIQMQECLIERYGEVAEFEGKRVHVWPTASLISKTNIEEIYKDCKWGYRAKFLVKTAEVIQSGFPTIEDLKQLTPERAKQKIMELPGIGDYSADLMNPHGGFSIDAWSVDIFGKLFFGKDAETNRSAIEKIKTEGIKRWGKWARTAFVYVVHDIARLSKRTGIELRLS
jgi:3-methyladenine DNA glycosylase/8-oxoguanine DNA glycosylase